MIQALSLSLSVAPSTPRPTPEASHLSSSCQADESVAWECPTGTCQSYRSSLEAVSAAKLFGMSGLGASEQRCGLNTSSFLPSKDVFLSDAQRAIGKNLGLLAEENKPLSIGRNDCGFNMGLRWKREEGSNRFLLLHAHLSLGCYSRNRAACSPLDPYPIHAALHSQCSFPSTNLIMSCPTKNLSLSSHWSFTRHTRPSSQYFPLCSTSSHPRPLDYLSPCQTHSLLPRVPAHLPQAFSTFSSCCQDYCFQELSRDGLRHQNAWLDFSVPQHPALLLHGIRPTL